MTVKQVAVPAALALIIAVGVPAQANGGNRPTLPFCIPTPVKCSPTPVVCPPAPAKCSPVPECGLKGAVPEPASVALVGVGSLLLLPLAVRALKSRQQPG